MPCLANQFIGEFDCDIHEIMIRCFVQHDHTKPSVRQTTSSPFGNLTDCSAPSVHFVVQKSSGGWVFVKFVDDGIDLISEEFMQFAEVALGVEGGEV